MKYKMISCDVDGTLVVKNLPVSEENKKAINEINKQGIPFVPCSGRTLAEMQELVDNPDIRYIIYSNGAGILDKKTGEVIENGFPYEVKKKILEVIASYDVYPFLHADGKCFIAKNFKGKENIYNLGEALCDIANNIALCLDDFDGSVMEMSSEYISIFFKNYDDLEKCRKDLLADERVVVAEPWPYNLEIFYAEAGKANAIKTLSQKLGIDISEVICIGDSNNDIGALEVAGLAIAVSNGSDEAKNVADVIACSNEENVVEYVLKHYLE